MVDLCAYGFKYLDALRITPAESFMNAHSEEIYKSKQFRTSNKELQVNYDNKYEKAYLHKVKKNQCQHLTEIKPNEVMKLLQKIDELFDGTLGIRKTDPV